MPPPRNPAPRGKLLKIMLHQFSTLPLLYAALIASLLKVLLIEVLCLLAYLSIIMTFANLLHFAWGYALLWHQSFSYLLISHALMGLIVNAMVLQGAVTKIKLFLSM